MVVIKLDHVQNKISKEKPMKYTRA